MEIFEFVIGLLDIAGTLCEVIGGIADLMSEVSRAVRRR